MAREWRLRNLHPAIRFIIDSVNHPTRRNTETGAPSSRESPAPRASPAHATDASRTSTLQARATMAPSIVFPGRIARGMAARRRPIT